MPNSLSPEKRARPSGYQGTNFLFSINFLDSSEDSPVHMIYIREKRRFSLKNIEFDEKNRVKIPQKLLFVHKPEPSPNKISKKGEKIALRLNLDTSIDNGPIDVSSMSIKKSALPIITKSPKRSTGKSSRRGENFSSAFKAYEAKDIPMRKKIENPERFFPIVTSGLLFDHKVYFARSGLTPQISRVSAVSSVNTTLVQEDPDNQPETLEQALKSFDKKRLQVINGYKEQVAQKLRGYMSNVSTFYCEKHRSSPFEEMYSPPQSFKLGHRKYKSQIAVQEKNVA